jgi:hypothetical protein
MKGVAGKVAIVTGASKGIGAGSAKALAAAGAAVVVRCCGYTFFGVVTNSVATSCLASADIPFVPQVP